MAIESEKDECFACKIISYGTVIGVVIYSGFTFKRAPVSSGILGAIGFNGLLAFIYRDLTEPSKKEA